MFEAAEIFVSVVENKNFSKAARKLNFMLLQ
jgi:DNA-binding transcriptional LysR family regulator